MSALRTVVEASFRHCGFIFTGYAPAMKLPFSEQLAGYTALEIIAALACPRATPYDWKDGRRHPPLWQQPIFIREIERHVKKARKKPKGG